MSIIDSGELDRWNEGNERARRVYHGFSITDSRHGTVAGYSQHIRSRLAPCDACRAAQTRYVKRWKLQHLDGRQATVPALGTRRRVQALLRIGWPMRYIATQADVGIGSISRIARAGSPRVQKSVAGRIAAVYDRLSGTPGPSTTSARRAAAKKWAAPLAWDDIDRDEQPQGVSHAA